MEEGGMPAFPGAGIPAEHRGAVFFADLKILRACFKTRKGPATRNFGRSRGGEDRASPQRAVRSEPTTDGVKMAVARPVLRSLGEGGRVFAQKAIWLRCSSVTAPLGDASIVAPRHPGFCAKTGPLLVSKQALRIFP